MCGTASIGMGAGAGTTFGVALSRLERRIGVALNVKAVGSRLSIWRCRGDGFGVVDRPLMRFPVSGSSRFRKDLNTSLYRPIGSLIQSNDSNQSINQSINPSIDQSINQPNQAINLIKI